MDVLTNGSPAEAEEAMRDHIVRSMERTITRLESYFAMGKKQGTRYVRSGKSEPAFGEASVSPANGAPVNGLAS
jgi:hypothetical protein